MLSPSRGWLLDMSFGSKFTLRKLPTKHSNDAGHAVMIASGGRHRLACVGLIDMRAQAEVFRARRADTPRAMRSTRAPDASPLCLVRGLDLSCGTVSPAADPVSAVTEALPGRPG